MCVLMQYMVDGSFIFEKTFKLITIKNKKIMCNSGLLELYLSHYSRNKEEK